MIEPSQPHVKLMRRKSSFEDYQRRLVDKIKRHFERRRKQWENNIENQVQHISKEELPPSSSQVPISGDLEERVYINIDSASETRLHPERETSRVVPSLLTTGHSSDKCEQITLISTETTDFPDEAKRKYSFMVDIKSFLPFGSVTVCQEETGLMLIGESNCSGCRSRGRRGLARTHEKYIEIGGVLENDSMRVHTTREGIMNIDVVASIQKITHSW